MWLLIILNRLLHWHSLRHITFLNNLRCYIWQSINTWNRIMWRVSLHPLGINCLKCRYCAWTIELILGFWRTLTIQIARVIIRTLMKIGLLSIRIQLSLLYVRQRSLNQWITRFFGNSPLFRMTFHFLNFNTFIFALFIIVVPRMKDVYDSGTSPVVNFIKPINQFGIPQFLFFQDLILLIISVFTPNT